MSLQIQFPKTHERWDTLEIALQKLKSVTKLDDAFKLLGHLYFVFHMREEEGDVSRTPFSGLQKYMLKYASDDERLSFLDKVLPTIASLVLDASNHQPDPPISIIKQQNAATISLSRKFAACIVATGFLCLFEDLEDKHQLSMPSVNFSHFFKSSGGSNIAKLKMILSFFEQLSAEIPKGNIVFRRLVLSEEELLTKDSICNMNQDLCAFIVDHTNKIEDAGKNVLQVDFANAFLGGGVLFSGNVQEEIRFSICPELLSSMLFMESMAENEAVVIQGFEQFSKYDGYGGSVRYVGKHDDSSSKDENGQILTAITAIDAAEYGCFGNIEQFSSENVLRDINKAYVGFYQPYLQKHEVPPETSDPQWAFKLNPERKRTIASGNWGCGVFGGNPELKSLLQWLAASIAHCPVLIYYTFNDPKIAGLDEMVKIITERHWTVSKLATEVFRYCEELLEKEDEMDLTLFEFLEENVQ